MSTELLASFCLIVALGAMLLGPNGLLIITNTIVHGPKTAFVTLLGTLSAFYIHGLFSVIGISALIMSSAKAFMLVKAVGVAYLFYLGINSLLQAIKHNSSSVELEIPKEKRKKTLYKAWTQGFITNFLNPKVSMFYIALFPQFVSNTVNIAASTVFLVTIQVVIVGIWFFSVALFAGRAIGGGHPILIRAIKGTVGTLMLWFGFNLAKVPASA